MNIGFSLMKATYIKAGCVLLLLANRGCLGSVSVQTCWRRYDLHLFHKLAHVELFRPRKCFQSQQHQHTHRLWCVFPLVLETSVQHHRWNLGGINDHIWSFRFYSSTPSSESPNLPLAVETKIIVMIPLIITFVTKQLPYFKYVGWLITSSLILTPPFACCLLSHWLCDKINFKQAT